MKIDSVNLNNFRNYQNAKITFENNLNFVVGKNAQGKTNLLESIYIVSVGKSPKNSKDKQIIKFDEDKAKIGIFFNTLAGNKSIELFLDKSNKKTIKINNLNIFKLTELVGTLATVYFSPDELKLIKEVPEDRRHFLDVSISQFNKPYLYELLKYNKILKQRNSILKSLETRESKIEQLKLFTPQLIDSAEKIISTRIKFINNIQQFVSVIHNQITKTENLKIEYNFYKNNSNIKQELLKSFESSLEKELELGYTCVGPHRDDIIFKLNNLDCRYYASQGQQRTVALSVKLALMEVIKNEIGEYPILLLDDVLSELDADRQDNLLQIVNNYQTIITCTDLPKTNLKFNTIKIENGALKN